MRATTLFPVVLVFSISLLWSPSAEGARILGVWPWTTPSHFFPAIRLFKELAAKGHQVTMISSFPLKTPVQNYRDIGLKDIKKKWTRLLYPHVKKNDLWNIGTASTREQILFTSMVGSAATEVILEEESVQGLLADKHEKFDLIIFEIFYNEALYGLAHHYNCPVIVLSTMGPHYRTNHLVGNPGPATYIPNIFTKYSAHMNLFQRIHNTLVNFLVEVHLKLFYFPQIDKTMHKYFPNAPSLNELMYRKTAMILLNSHSSSSDPRPIVPAMVEIGGFHVEPPKPLPKDLKDYMDNATEGVVLFSMGSNLQCTDLEETKRNEILRAFGKLKYKIIWKWEDENLPGKSHNVKIMKWLPQSDLMGHPNLKLFITHGGILSSTEAVYYGVPIIGIPIFGDQMMNVAMTTRKGIGIELNYADLNEETLTHAINTVLGNPKYSENAKKASELLHEQPMKPLDSAIFWVNHVIKHKGADHFRSSALDLEWYQLYSVDLVAIFVLANLVATYITYWIGKKFCCKKKSLEENNNVSIKMKN